MYVHISTRIHGHTDMHADVHTCVHACIHTHTLSCTACTYTHTYTCMHALQHLHETRTGFRVWGLGSSCTYTHTYVIHTHIHMHACLLHVHGPRTHQTHWMRYPKEPRGHLHRRPPDRCQSPARGDTCPIVQDTCLSSLIFHSSTCSSLLFWTMCASPCCTQPTCTARRQKVFGVVLACVRSRLYG